MKTIAGITSPFYLVLALVLSFSLVLSVFTQNAVAAINEQIAFYGTLQNDSGVNLSGTYDMVFRFYDAPTGGTLLDTSAHTASNGNAVTVSNGEFSTMLGSGTGNTLDGLNFNSGAIYVGLTIGTDSEMSPRERLAASAYAFNTDKVDGYDANQLLRYNATGSMTATDAGTLFSLVQNGVGDIINIFDGATKVFTVRDGGNVGIGTSTPSQKLTVAGDTRLTGRLYDNTNTAGSNGMVLQSTGAGFRWVATSTLGIASGGLSALDIDTSAELRAILTDETGTGVLVFGTSPTLTTPTIAKLANLTTNGFVKTIGADGTLVIDTVTYLSAAVTSFNGQTNAVQTFASSSIGTDFKITSSGGVHTFQLPSASNIARGLLASSDWISFNGRISSSSLDTSSELAALITNETGSGALVFGTNATLASTTLSGRTALFNASTTNLTLRGKLFDVTNNAGTKGMVLLTTGTSTRWVATSTLGISGGPGGSLFTDAGATTYLTALGDNLAIGSTSATSRLSVAGEINIDGNYGLSINGIRQVFADTIQKNIAFGEGTGQYFDVGTLNNIAIGYQASQNASSTWALDIFSDNIVIGYKAGQNAVTNSAILIGHEAGKSAYYGIGDISIGYQAGMRNQAEKNIFLGYQAGASTTDSASEFNTIIGDRSGFNAEGSGNVYIGHEAGFNATSSDGTIAIGNGAGRNSAENYGSVMVGLGAGYSNRGDSIIAIGINAGNSNTGNENVMLGYGAGEVNTGFLNFFGNNSGIWNTGNSNVMIGGNTGNLNTGSYNNFFGPEAGMYNKGNGNNFFGSAAGKENSGRYNNFLGYNTGRYLRATTSDIIGSEAFRGSSIYSAQNNVALGYRTGFTATAGASNNILIGFQAADNLTSGTNNIVIGYDTDLPVAAGTQQLAIGNLIYGTGLNGTGLTISTGKIGIGTSSPTAQFSTTGTVRFSNFGAGTLQTDSRGNLSVSSDERLKNITGDFDSDISAILNIKPIEYKWNTLSGFETETTYVGFSAQNVQDNIPKAVGTDKNGYLTLSDRGILAAVVNAIKEIWERLIETSTKVETLESDVTNLQSELQEKDAALNALQQRIEHLESGAQSEPSSEPTPVPGSNTSENASGTVTEEILPVVIVPENESTNTPQ